MIAALSLTSCKKNKAEEEIKTPVTIEIPFVSDFTCDYYTTDGMQIADKTTRFDHDGEVRVKIGFKLSKAAYEAGKREFTIRFLLPLGFTGDIFEANTSDTFDADLSAVYAVDDRNDKDCRFEARIKFNYSSGILSFGYNYDEEEVVTVGNQPLKCGEAFIFEYDEESDGYAMFNDPECNGWPGRGGLEIPEMFAGKPITVIGDETFLRCGMMESVTIPSSVIRIGGAAFKDCQSLTSITIPNGVTSIDIRAFSGCTNLTSVDLPKGVKTITEGVFEYCDNLANVTIPDGVTMIGESVFYGCESLTGVTVPTGVSSIGKYAFYDCKSLIGVTIPDAITSIGEYAFYGCESLKHIAIPNGVESIERYTFYGCKSLADITIPADVTSIGESAFYDCGSLTDLTIPDGVIIIEKEAFSGCGGLTSITLPEGITSIGEESFNSCGGLTEIKIPFGVAKVCRNAFKDCGLAKIMILNRETSIDFSAFDKCPVEEATIPTSVIPAISKSKLLKSVEITDGEAIKEGAFKDCTVLESVTIASSVTSIGESAFYNCTGMKNVYISDFTAWYKIEFGDYYSNPLYYAGNLYLNNKPVTQLVISDDVTEIKACAFIGCRSLTSVTIPDGVTKIGSGAFIGCSSLTSVTIPDSIIKVGNDAFENCTGLKRVKVSDLDFWYKIDFDGYYSNPLHYAHNLYLNDTLVTEIVVPDVLTAIKEYAFVGCSGLTSVTIGDKIAGIGKYAFDECTGLNRVNITDLAAWCKIDFDGYYSNPLQYADTLYLGESPITELAIPNGIRAIKDYAFGGYSGLTSVTIGDSVTTIGRSAFGYCKGLVSVTLGRGVTSIGKYAFYYCDGLTSVHISDVAAWCKVDFADHLSNPLYYAKNLYLNGSENPTTELVIPNGVSEIKNYAFNGSGCKNITSIIISNSVTSIAKYALSGCSIETATLPLSVISGVLTKKLKNITITSGGSINKDSLIGCTELVSVAIGNNATSIGEYAFSDFTALTSITIGDGVTIIGDYAFNHCASLTSVIMGKGVKSIGSEAFCGCSALTSLKVGENVTSIRSRAFLGCYKLARVTIPHSISNIEKLAFYNCGIKTIIFEGTESEWVTVSSKIGNLYYYPNGRMAVEIKAVCVADSSSELVFYLYIDE